MLSTQFRSLWPQRALLSKLLHATPALSRLLHKPCPLASRRLFSTRPVDRNDLFNYTSGRWIFNDSLRHAERKRVFNIDGLRNLAAESVNRSPKSIVNLVKLADGWNNRKFLITMDDGFRMVASIPYQSVQPKRLTVASEAATMEFLRAQGIPIPDVYDYSPTSENPAETEYIFTKFVRGTQLSTIWKDMNQDDIVEIISRIAEVESKTMNITFPAGGSLYFTDDLRELNISGIPLSPNNKFSIGPDLRLPLWFGRRAQLSTDRGPYKSSEEALVAGPHKELMFLEKFGQDLWPLNRYRRKAYRWKPQSPTEYIENIHRYLHIAPFLAPKNSSQNDFCIRHPELDPSRIFVNSDLKITGIVGWGRTSILPMFLHAGISNAFKTYSNPITSLLDSPELSEDMKADYPYMRDNSWEVYRQRLVHHQYLRYTQEYKPRHYAMLEDESNKLRRRLFSQASQPWEGDPLLLKVPLIEATEKWDTLTGDSICPISFESDDVLKTKELDGRQMELWDKVMQVCEMSIGCDRNGWVSNETYDESKDVAEYMKEMLGNVDDEKVLNLVKHWPFDDMDEEMYK